MFNALLRFFRSDTDLVAKGNILLTESQTRFFILKTMLTIYFVYRGSKFVIKMSRDSYNHLKRHLQEKKHHKLLNIIQEHLFIDGKKITNNVVAEIFLQKICPKMS